MCVIIKLLYHSLCNLECCSYLNFIFGMFSHLESWFGSKPTWPHLDESFDEYEHNRACSGRSDRCKGGLVIWSRLMYRIQSFSLNPDKHDCARHGEGRKTAKMFIAGVCKVKKITGFRIKQTWTSGGSGFRVTTYWSAFARATHQICFRQTRFQFASIQVHNRSNFLLLNDTRQTWFKAGYHLIHGCCRMMSRLSGSCDLRIRPSVAPESKRIYMSRRRRSMWISRVGVLLTVFSPHLKQRPEQD